MVERRVSNGRPPQGRRPATIEELEAALRIDRNNLDDAIAHQHELYYEVCKQVALRMAEVDSAKAGLKEIEAEVDAAIRGEAANNDERITETMIASMKLRDRDVKRQKQTILDLELKYARLQALEKSYHQRNAALERLLTWHMRQYYDPIRLDRAGRPMRDIDAELAKQARAKEYARR